MGGMEIFFVVFFASGVDFITLIPFLGMVVGWMFWILFYMYLAIRGISPRAKNFVTGGVSTFFELIPILQMLPTITVGVVMIILQIRRQDRKKAKAEAEKAKKKSAESKASREDKTPVQ